MTPELLLLLTGSAVAGAVWRRVLGGWNHFYRPYVVTSGLLLTWPLFQVLPPLWAVAGGFACVGFWTISHRVDHDLKTLLRYGPFGLGWIVARHLRVRPWTIYGELFAGGSFWGTLTGVCWWFG